MGCCISFDTNPEFMKTIFAYFLTILLAFSFSNTSASNQPVPSGKSKKTVASFQKLNVHRQQQGIAVTWTMDNGDGILGFVIEKSYDNIYFEEAGTCDYDLSGRQHFLDNSFFPGYIYYRVIAVMADGSTQTSETVMIRIVSRK